MMEKSSSLSITAAMKKLNALAIQTHVECVYGCLKMDMHELKLFKHFLKTTEGFPETSKDFLLAAVNTAESQKETEYDNPLSKLMDD